jgi:aminoglycoside phosphotransferase (APT) family kinase protein
MRHQRGGHRKLDEVADRLGTRLRAAEPVGWGDARATYRLSLADGRSVAARRVMGNEPRARVEHIGRLMTGLAGAGLPVPVPTSVETAGGPWLITPWVEGETGASWLGDPERARQLADRMGRLANRLRSVDLREVSLADDDGVTAQSPEDARELVFVHGDFAPVNVVMTPEGEVAALLDFEHAGTGPPLLDVAWWGWVVRHHHPEAWAAAWPAFLRSAGLACGRVEARLHELALRTLADRAGAVGDDAAARRRWLDRLAVARTWSVPGNQAT